MSSQMSRRSLVRFGLAAGALVPALAPLKTLAGAVPPLLDANDPMARALGFTREASNVDPKANPNYRPGQTCLTCVQYLGRAGDAVGGCNIFPDHTVPPGGWCRTWAAKRV